MIEAHQADDVDPVSPQTVNLNLRRKPDNNGRMGANLGRDCGPHVRQTALWSSDGPGQERVETHLHSQQPESVTRWKE